METALSGKTLISVGDLFRESFRIYRDRFAIFAGIMAAPVAISIAGAFMGQDLIGIISAFLGGIAYLFAYVALVASMKGNDAAAAYRVSFSLIFPYLWIALLVNLLNIGGMVFGIIPGIIFSIWFSLAPFILVDTSSRGFEALLRSKEYVKGFWWPVFGRLLLAGLLVGLFNVALLGIAEPFKESMVIVYAIPAIVQFLGLPFIITFAWTLYQSLKEAKPGVEGVPPPKKGKGFFVFSAILGVLVPLILIAIVSAVYLSGIIPDSPQYFESPAEAG